MTEFPKDRDGLRSFVGRTAARDIAGDGLWLKKQRFGAVGWNRGGALEVRPAKQQAYDGWYSLGSLQGALHVLGALNVQGVYMDRGKFTISTGFADYSPNSLYYYGNGFGSTPMVSYIGVSNDFNEKPSVTYDLSQWRTYNGTKFDKLYSTYMNMPRVNLTNPIPYVQAVYITRASRVRNGTTWTYYRAGMGYVAYRADLGQYAFTYIVDKGDGAAFLGNTLTRPYQLAFEFDAVSISPRNMVALGKYLRPEYDQHPEITHPGDPPLAHPIDVAACPGFDIFYSYTNGESWEPGASSTIFSEFVDTIVPLAPTIDNAQYYFNPAVEGLYLSVAPISNRYAIVMALVPYYDGGPLKAKVKLGLMDSAAKTIFETAVIFDGTLVDANTFTGGIVPVPGGAVFTTKPLGALDPLDNPRVCHFTPDGLSIVDHPPMPYPLAPMPCWLMSSPYPSALNRLAVTVFDGKYSVYESRDNGANWERRGTITDKAVAPVKIPGATRLVDFGVSTQLRQANVPGPIAPSVPWNADEAYDPPIL